LLPHGSLAAAAAAAVPAAPACPSAPAAAAVGLAAAPDGVVRREGSGAPISRKAAARASSGTNALATLLLHDAKEKWMGRQ
jgi:hypothetical protein